MDADDTVTCRTVEVTLPLNVALSLFYKLQHELEMEQGQEWIESALRGALSDGLKTYRAALGKAAKQDY